MMHVLKAICLVLFQSQFNAIVLAAILPTPQSMQILNSLLLPGNLTLPSNRPTPPDPYWTSIHGTAVEFFDYRNRLDSENAIETFIQARQECDTHLPHDQHTRMRPAVKTYTSGNVILVLVPWREMTWNVYNQALVVMILFARNYGYLGLSFVVWSRGFGVGSVGTGI